MRKIVAALIVLALMSGLTIYAVNRAISNANISSEISYESDLDTSAEPSVSAPAEIPITDSLDDTSDNSQNGTDSGETESSANMMPVQGDITKAYSGESLVYSATLDQYLSHKALDIAAPAGSPVSAVMEGTVTDVGQDDRDGTYVTVAHGNGLETKYCLPGRNVSFTQRCRKQERPDRNSRRRRSV